MNSTLLFLFISLCSESVYEPMTVIDLASDTNKAANQIVINNFYAKGLGRLTIYYSFGSLVMEHHSDHSSLNIMIEEELNEAVAELDKATCPLNIATQINWFYLDTGLIREVPPSKGELMKIGCNPINYNNSTQ